jgi:hypothetical protein
MDTCKHCTARGDLDVCRATPCNTHGSWYAQEQDQEIAKLKNELKELKRYTTKLILEYRAEKDYGKFIDWYNNDGEQQ